MRTYTVLDLMRDVLEIAALAIFVAFITLLAA